MNRLYLFILVGMLPFLAAAQLDNVTQVTLNFTPGSGEVVTATATATGTDLTVDGPINLLESTEYTLSIVLTSGDTDLTSVVTANANNLQLFFAPSEGLFEGDVTYNDEDTKEFPLGLSTTWTGSCVEGESLTGSFRIVVKDLTGIKSANSTIDDGATIIDLSWDINIADDAAAPECENEEEVIDKVTLTFTPTAGGDPIIAVAADPDGPGPLDLEVPDITLMESTEYELAIMLENTIEGEDITEEIMEEDDEHLFLFAFGEGLFEDPDGNGNIDNRVDPINYNDRDDNQLDVGLSTNWTTACTAEGNVTDTFRVVLKHQPDIKTATSGFNDGGTDLNILWNITIVDDAAAPECENEEEVIDKVTLTFTPTAGGDPIIAVAADPDGPGPLDLEVPDITLMESTEYELAIMLENTIEGEDITEEIMEEDDEHLFLFAFGEGLFEDPDGNGNIDNRVDPINYNDRDDNQLDVGLSTNWTTACTAEGNVTDTFRVVLKHQPDIKTATSGFNDGGTDINILWNITIVDDAEAPECENEEEVIDKVTLTFTPTAGGDPIIAVAADPDGPGPLDLEVPDITLMESTEYDLAIMLENTIEGEDITEEIMEEDDEHIFLFSFGQALFDTPSGDGNVDRRLDPIRYNDEDDNGLPVGLSTNWTTACTAEGNITDTFRVVLKHQPDIKTATSGFNDGGTDINILWNITIVDDAAAPECENEEEVIDKITLIFAPVMGGDTIVATATDPDGPGPLDLEVDDISLVQNTEYELSIMLENTIEGENITAEIDEEAEEHQFFFAWTGDIFSDPMGDGNIDNAADLINYTDEDANGLPVGLFTKWTTNVAMSSGTFRTVLKHQPEIKTATSTSNDGGTDIDITWSVNAVVTSLDNLSSDQKLTIAPNPVQENLYLLTENIDLTNTEMVIYNNLGGVVKMIPVSANRINVSDLPAGTYVLSVQGNNIRAVRRFAKLN